MVEIAYGSIIIFLDDLNDEVRTQVMDELGIKASDLDPASETFISENPLLTFLNVAGWKHTHGKKVELEGDSNEGS